MSEKNDSTHAFAELQARLPGDLRPVRPFAPRRRMVIFMVLFVPLTALVLWRVFGWRSDQGALGSPWMWGLSILELAAALWLLVRVVREVTPGRRSSLALLGFGVAGTAVIHVAVILATFAQSQVYPDEGYEWLLGLYCFAFEVAIGIPCVLFALWLGRRGLTSSPRRLGILGGVGAGLAADAIWRLVCPYSALDHAFGSHSAGILALVAFGLFVAAIWESLRNHKWRTTGPRW